MNACKLKGEYFKMSNIINELEKEQLRPSAYS